MGLCSAGHGWDKPLHLRQTPLDGSLPYNSIEAVSGAFTLHNFENGDYLVRKGDPSDSVLAIVSGHAHVLLAEGENEATSLAVPISSNNFIGGFGLVHEGKANSTREALSVVGAGPGMYVKLTQAAFTKLKSSHPSEYQVLRELIGLRLALLNIPFFRGVVKEWPEEAKHAFATLFRYQSFCEHEELIAEAGKAADRLLILVKGRIHLANLAKEEEVLSLSERGKLLNLTSLFYNHGQNSWDIMAAPQTDTLTQVMTLKRSDFNSFKISGIADCRIPFERASIEYLLREMRAQNRLFFPLVEEKHMPEFCGLWKLKEYRENVKISICFPTAVPLVDDNKHDHNDHPSNHNHHNANAIANAEKEGKSSADEEVELKADLEPQLPAAREDNDGGARAKTTTTTTERKSGEQEGAAASAAAAAAAAAGAAEGKLEAQEQQGQERIAGSIDDRLLHSEGGRGGGGDSSCTRGGSSFQTKTRNLFHVIIGGSADAYSNERQVKNNRQVKKAFRREHLYGSGVGILSPTLARMSKDLTYFSGQTRCLTLTLDQEHFERFFNKIGKLETAMALAEQAMTESKNQDPTYNPSITSRKGYPSRLGESPSQSKKSDVKFAYAHTITPVTGTVTSLQENKVDNNSRDSM